MFENHRPPQPQITISVDLTLNHRAFISVLLNRMKDHDVSIEEGNNIEK